ncbi:hypothetical protein [Flavicella sediminum]|uniref:hypothetical protein n=1 Tax=Flavicella sediminum TaxID=2585141 RepID=UPI00112358AE|nr:hypothetical protein [Flavicella sediminum]
MKEAFLGVYQVLKKMSENPDLLCAQFWLKIKKLHETYNEQEVWELMFDNMEWLIQTKVISSKYLLNNFTIEELAAHNIYLKDKVIIKNKRAILFGSAEAEVSGHSLIVQFEQSESKCYDTTFVKLYDQAKTTVNGCMAEGFNESIIIGKGYSRIEAWDNVTVSCKESDFVVLQEGAIEIKK